MAKDKQIKDTNVIKTPEVVVQPQFAIPPDLVDVRPATQAEIQYDPFPSPEAGDFIVVDEDTVQTQVVITVLSQTLRTTADGITVVDVVLGVDGPADSYDWRLSVA